MGHKKTSLAFFIVITIIILGVVFVVVYRSLISSIPVSSRPILSDSSWKEIGPVITGRFADADIIDLGGKFRMYYSVEPEVIGNKLEMYSSVSSDGINWVKEANIRKEFAAFPDVIKLPNGNFRLYFQNMGTIKSAISTDGLTWVDEPGIRINKNESGFNLDTVGAQSTVLLNDGTYLIVYRGVENKPYGKEKLPNRTTSYYFYAISSDGINFSKKGIAFDTQNDTLKGFADGAEWVKWDNGQLRLYFWSYRGIYHVIYQNGIFSLPEFDFSNNPNLSMPANPPSDPTLMKINGKWFMYYGQHTKGIYYALLK